jgi:hypothetical protein
LKDDAEVKVVCQNVGDLDHPEKAQASGIMTIPARCVLSIERLTEVDRPISSADPAVAAPAADGREIASARKRRAL